MPVFSQNNGGQSPFHSSEVADEKHGGSLEYVAQQGENGSVPTYQEASGAPVEVRSPLGYRVQWFTIIFLNIGQMVGTGVFSTRKPNLDNHFSFQLIDDSR